MAVVVADGQYARVNREWEGKTVAVIASGPSLTPLQVAAVRHLPRIVVNDIYLQDPEADVLYWADAKWLVWHRGRAEFKAFKGLKVSISTGMEQMKGAALFLKNAGDAGGTRGPLSADPTMISTGSNSGYQALNIAVLAGAKRILLLGVDGKRGAGERKHCFGDHPDKSEPPYAAMKSAFRHAAESAKALGVEVINCSPGTAIDVFRRMTVEDALAEGVVPA